MLAKKYAAAKKEFAEANFDLDDFCMKFMLKHYLNQSQLNTMLTLAKSRLKKSQENK